MTSFALRNRRVLLSGLSAILAVLTLQAPPDYFRFAALGDEILTGHLGSVYASDWNQAGPLQLVLSRVLLLGVSFDGHPAWPVVFVLQAGMVLFLLSIGGTSDSPAAVRRDLVVGVGAMLWSAIGQPWNGHPAEMLVSIGWLVALRQQRAGRWGLAALAFAASAAIAPWGVLAVPSLWAVASLRQAVRTATVAVILSITAYLPFAMTGHFELFRHHWPIDHGSLMHLIDPGANFATWGMRLLQAVAVAGGCALVAYRSRRSHGGPVYALLAAALLRIACDPAAFDYYWLSVAVLSLGLLAGVSTAPPWPLIGLGYLAWAAASVLQPWIGAMLCLGLLIRSVWVTRTAPISDDAGYGVPAHAG